MPLIEQFLISELWNIPPRGTFLRSLQSAVFWAEQVMPGSGMARDSAYRGRGWLLVGDYTSCTQLGTDLLPTQDQSVPIITARIEQQNTCLRRTYTLIRTQLSPRKSSTKRGAHNSMFPEGQLDSNRAEPGRRCQYWSLRGSQQYNLSFTVLSTQSQQ